MVLQLGEKTTYHGDYWSKKRSGLFLHRILLQIVVSYSQLNTPHATAISANSLAILGRP